jgi:AraC family transcriptional regulator
MIHASHQGCPVVAVPDTILLPPAANGYRRKLYPGRGVSVYCDRHPPNEWGEHQHRQDQISILLEMAGCWMKAMPTDGEWTETYIQGPAVWVVPAGVPHALVYPAEADMVTLFLKPAFVRDTPGVEKTAFVLEPLSVMAGRDELIGRLCQVFREVCRQPEAASSIFVESIGTVLATQLMQSLFGSVACRPRKGRLSDTVLHRVSQFIEECLTEKLTVAALMQLAGYKSESSFRNAFRLSFGFKPHDYVMRQRVARAEEMLKATPFKVVEVAHACGFSDDTHMARWFRRVSGRLPRDLRA